MEINYLTKEVKNDSEAMMCSLAWEQPILGNVTDPGMQSTWHQVELGMFFLFPGASRFHTWPIFSQCSIIIIV